MGMAFKGVGKLNEECGEVVQVAGKIFQVGDIDAEHWSGDLRKMLEDEIADVLAAIEFVIDRNHLSIPRIRERAERKFDLFEKWEQE